MRRGERASGFRRRGGGSTSSLFDQLHNGIALLRVDAAELVLDVQAGLPTGVEQIFALHAQLAS
jgi:hypothetical protein